MKGPESWGELSNSEVDDNELKDRLLIWSMIEDGLEYLSTWTEAVPAYRQLNSFNIWGSGTKQSSLRGKLEYTVAE